MPTCSEQIFIRKNNIVFRYKRFSSIQVLNNIHASSYEISRGEYVTAYATVEIFNTLNITKGQTNFVVYVFKDGNVFLHRKQFRYSQRLYLSGKHRDWIKLKTPRFISFHNFHTASANIENACIFKISNFHPVCYCSTLGLPLPKIVKFLLFGQLLFWNNE